MATSYVCIPQFADIAPEGSGCQTGVIMRWIVFAVAGFVSGCGYPSANLTYSASCAEPRPGWKRPGAHAGRWPLWHNMTRNSIWIAADGTLRWNGNPVSGSTLREKLVFIRDLRPPMAVILRVDADADCETVGTIRSDMEALLNCRSSGLCGEGDGEWN